MNGIWTVIPTIFNKDDSINFNDMDKLIARQIENNVDGIVLHGTTSEVSTISDEEQINILNNLALKYLNKIKIMIGVGGNNTKDVENNIKLFSKYCNYVMITVPYYNRPNQEGLQYHFQYLSNKFQNVEMVLYNIPGRTGVNLEVDTLVNICNSCSNIIGIKEASGNIHQIKETINRTKISVMLGDDSLVIPGMALGCHGLISVVSNIVPSHMIQIYKECQINNYHNALKIYNKIESICKTCFITSNPIPLKMILKRLELTSSELVRLPLIVPKNEKILDEINSCTSYCKSLL